MKFKWIPEKERVFNFLASLNPELDQVRRRILMEKLIPSIREVYNEVRRDRSRL